MGNKESSNSFDVLDMGNSTGTLTRSRGNFMQRFGSGRKEKNPKTKKKKKSSLPNEGGDEDILTDYGSKASVKSETENQNTQRQLEIPRQRDISNDGNASQGTSSQEKEKGIPIANREESKLPESSSYTEDLKSKSSTSQEHPSMYMRQNREPGAIAVSHVKNMDEEEIEEFQDCNEQMDLQVEDGTYNVRSVHFDGASSSNEVFQESEDSPLSKHVTAIVAKYIGFDWKKLGRQLALDDPEVESIAVGSNYGTEDMAHQVLYKWRQRRSSKATNRVLAQNLEEMGRSDIAEKIKGTSLKSYRTQLSSRLSDASLDEMDDIVEKTKVWETVKTNSKEGYRNFRMKGLPWMTKYVFTLQEYYVDLVMKTDDRTQKASQQLQIEEIFTPTDLRRTPLRILIEGGPGSGKTTLAAKLAYDWATGKDYISHFDLVLLLPVRLFVGTCEDTLARAASVKGIHKDYFLKSLKEESYSMLFILDGYDEASSNTEEEILPLIKKCVYPKSTVIITSRPGEFTSIRYEVDEFLAAADVAPTFSRFICKRVTVKGFNEEQQKMFIDKHMHTFSQEQKDNVRIKFAKMVDKEVLTCPLFLLMLIVLFTSKKEVEKSETKTGLYKHLFNLVIKRYFTKSREEFVESVDDVDLFCKRDDKPYYIELMSQFSEFALKILNSKSLIVSKEEIMQIYKYDLNILELGFLTQHVSLNGFCEDVLYEPVHKSLLEFAAAYGLYLSYDASRDFTSTTDIIKFRPTETSSLFFPFLVGLMGDNAGVLFKIIHSHAFEYSCKFELLYDSLLESNLTEPILNPLTAFLPPEWSIYSDPAEPNPVENIFRTSSQHEAIVGWGVQQSKIHQINWDVLQDACLPTSVVVDTLVLDMCQVEHVNNLLEIMKNNTQHNAWNDSENKLHCKYLWCSFSESVYEQDVSLDVFFDMLQFFDFQLISFDFSQSCIESELDLSQKKSHDPLKQVCTAIKTGKLKRVHLHSMTTGTYSSNPSWINSVNDLVDMDRIEVLELHVDGMTQIEIDQFLMYAVESINLRTVALLTTLPEADVEKLPFAVNLDKLCNNGRKSWNWVELSAVRVDCNETATAPFLIEHFEITSCWVSPAATKLMLRCRARSINCAAVLLSDTWSQWSCQASLTELNISIDTALMYRGLSSLTEKLRNIQILALTMKSGQRCKPSLPIEEWISNAISCLRLKGIEIWSFSKNTSLATAMVAGLIKCLEEHPSTFSSETHTQFDSVHPLLATQKSHMQYLMVNDLEAEAANSANYLQKLKNCLQHKTLQRLEMVLSTDSKFTEGDQTNNIFSKYSINRAFPRQEGFRVEHDLWGSRENDSIYSKGKHRISRKQKDRISITYKPNTQHTPCYTCLTCCLHDGKQT